MTQGSRTPQGLYYVGPMLSTQVAVGQGKGHGVGTCYMMAVYLGRKLEKLREKERKKEAKRKISSLSFTLEEEEEAGEEEEEMAMYEEELEREGEGKLGAPGRGPARSPLSWVSGSRADIHHPASIPHCARGPQPHTSGQERKSQVCSVCKAELGWGLTFSGRVSRSPAYIPWAQAWGLWCESLPG